MNGTDTEKTQRLGTATEEAFQIMASFTIAIYRLENQLYQLFGSGFLVKHAGQIFLVSAAHVLEKLKTEELYFFISPTEIASISAHISGKVFLSPCTGDRKNNLIDIGVTKLSWGSASPYPEIAQFAMDISYLKPRYLPRHAKDYLIVGYPASQSKTNKPGRAISSTRFGYDGTTSSDDVYTANGLSCESHLILTFNPSIGYDKNGNHRNFPKPQGMSGSPVWVHYDEDDSFSQERIFPVVAIGTAYIQGVGMISTDVSFAIDLIYKAADQNGFI